MSPLSNPVGVCTVLKAFFDTGGDFDSRHYDFLTLAGYSTEFRDAARIEKKWDSAVSEAWSKCSGMPDTKPFLHMTDLMCFANPFSRRNGWNETIRTHMLERCVLAITDASIKNKIRGVSSTIFLKDYKRIVKVKTDTPTPQVICCGFCVSSALAWKADIFIRDGAELFFDRGEQFIGYMLERWRNKKQIRKHDLTAWEKLRSIAEMNVSQVPMGQMADMLAWSINAAEYGQVDGDWQIGLLDVKRNRQRLDYEELSRPNQASLDEIKAFNFPRRSPVK